METLFLATSIALLAPPVPTTCAHPGTFPDIVAVTSGTGEPSDGLRSMHRAH